MTATATATLSDCGVQIDPKRPSSLPRLPLYRLSSIARPLPCAYLIWCVPSELQPKPMLSRLFLSLEPLLLQIIPSLSFPHHILLSTSCATTNTAFALLAPVIDPWSRQQLPFTPPPVHIPCCLHRNTGAVLVADWLKQFIIEPTAHRPPIISLQLRQSTSTSRALLLLSDTGANFPLRTRVRTTDTKDHPVPLLFEQLSSLEPQI